VEPEVSLQILRRNLTLVMVALYLLLDAPFMLVRIPPGGVASVPMGELLIVFFLLTVPADTKLAMPFLRTAPIVPLAIWWIVAIPQLVMGFTQYGFWALRDATSLIETLFLWIGFVVASAPGAPAQIIRWFNRTIFAGALIALSYPFRNFFVQYSPVIISAQGKPTPFFFTYIMTPMIGLTAAFSLFLSDKKYGGLRASWIAALLIVFVAAIFQARTIYMQIFFMFALLTLVQPANLLRLSAPIAVAVALFVALLAAGVPVPGRISGNVSLQFYLEHFLAIGGSGSGEWGDDTLRGAAAGVEQRLFWWGKIWLNVTSSWTTTLFGLGYGVSLVGLSAVDPSIAAEVREPHNSMISVFARTGVVGLIACVWMHITLAIIIVRTYLAYRAKGSHTIARWILTVGALFGMFWVASIGEDAFEKPFLAIPYYFFYGVVLNLWYRDGIDTVRRQPSPQVISNGGALPQDS
jgi:hypothetical protein